MPRSCLVLGDYPVGRGPYSSCEEPETVSRLKSDVAVELITVLESVESPKSEVTVEESVLIAGGLMPDVVGEP